MPFIWCQFCMGKHILQTSFFLFPFAIGLQVSPGAVKYILTPITAFIKKNTQNRQGYFPPIYLKSLNYFPGLPH